MKKIFMIMLVLLTIGVVSAATLRIESNTNCSVTVARYYLVGGWIVQDSYSFNDSVQEIYLPFVEQHDIPGIATNGYLVTGQYSVVGQGYVSIEEFGDVASENQTITYKFNDPMKTHSFK